MTNVLILEDNPAIASMLCVIAKRAKLDCLHFVTPSSAIKDGAIEKADFIITDFEMPPENALILLKYIKENDIKKPIIMHSAYQNIEEMIMESGYKDLINEYLEKPASVKRVIEIMNKYAR